MANEAVIIELGPNGGKPQRFTVANGTAITKGCLLQLSGDYTASASSGSGDVFAGIAAADKEASDGATEIAAYTEGIFDITNSAGAEITLGNIVTISGANFIRSAVAGDLLTGAVVGKALEAGSPSEVIRVDIGRKA